MQLQIPRGARLSASHMSAGLVTRPLPLLMEQSEHCHSLLYLIGGSVAFFSVQQPMYSTHLGKEAAAHIAGPATQMQQSGHGLAAATCELQWHVAGRSTGAAQAVSPLCSTALLQVVAYDSQRAACRALQQVPNMQQAPGLDSGAPQALDPKPLTPPCLQVLWLS